MTTGSPFRRGGRTPANRHLIRKKTTWTNHDSSKHNTASVASHCDCNTIMIVRTNLLSLVRSSALHAYRIHQRELASRLPPINCPNTSAQGAQPHCSDSTIETEAAGAYLYTDDLLALAGMYLNPPAKPANSKHCCTMLRWMMQHKSCPRCAQVHS